MKKTLETILNIICNLFILIIMGFGIYFLVMLKLIKIDPNTLGSYFGGNEADIALWNIRNVLNTKFVIILLIILLFGMGIFCLRFFTEKKSVSKISLGIMIKSIIMIIIVKCGRFLLGATTDYTTHLENNQGANIEYNTTLYK